MTERKHPAPGTQLSVFDSKSPRRRYFNTTHESGAAVVEYEKAAKYQDEKLFRFFCENPTATFTAWDIKGEPAFDHMLITSVRRSLDTLKHQGFIECVGKKKHMTGRNSLAYKFKSPIQET